MKWGILFCATAVAIVLILFEWPSVKNQPSKDRLVFLTLVMVSWVLSLFDLLNLPGPTTVVQAFFKPIGDALK